MTELPEISDNSESGSGTSSDSPDTGSFTQAIGPLFAAFSLPTIAQLIGQRPIPWPSVALFTAGTGFLVAGYQFSINNALPETQGPRKLRALRTYVGMAGIAGGLSLLVGSTKRDYRCWPLCVLGSASAFHSFYACACAISDRYLLRLRIVGSKAQTRARVERRTRATVPDA
jgi:hypothetical protein